MGLNDAFPHLTTQNKSLIISINKQNNIIAEEDDNENKTDNIPSIYNQQNNKTHQ